MRTALAARALQAEMKPLPEVGVRVGAQRDSQVAGIARRATTSIAPESKAHEMRGGMRVRGCHLRLVADARARDTSA